MGALQPPKFLIYRASDWLALLRSVRVVSRTSCLHHFVTTPTKTRLTLGVTIFPNRNNSTMFSVTRELQSLLTTSSPSTRGRHAGLKFAAKPKS